MLLYLTRYTPYKPQNAQREAIFSAELFWFACKQNISVDPMLLRFQTALRASGLCFRQVQSVGILWPIANKGNLARRSVFRVDFHFSHQFDVPPRQSCRTAGSTIHPSRVLHTNSYKSGLNLCAGGGHNRTRHRSVRRKAHEDCSSSRRRDPPSSARSPD
jgi:hypothetical protein